MSAHTVDTFVSVISTYITESTKGQITDLVEEHIKKSARAMAEKIVEQYDISIKAVETVENSSLVTLVSKKLDPEKQEEL